MLTDLDIKKLRKIFATKDDLKRFATKDDLKKYATKEDLKKMVDQIVAEITEIIGSLGEKIQKSLDELHSHRIILGDHEKRIQEVEEKVFPQI